MASTYTRNPFVFMDLICMILVFILFLTIKGYRVMAKPYHRIYHMYSGTALKAHRCVGITKLSSGLPRMKHKGLNDKLVANADGAFEQFLDHLHFVYQQKHWSSFYGQQGLYALGEQPHNLIAITDLRLNAIRLDTGHIETCDQIKTRTPNRGR